MRIMTGNIWGDYFGNPTTSRDDKLYGVFKKHTPDFLGLQEVTKGWYESSLFERLRVDYYFIGTELFDSRNYVPMAIKKGITLLSNGFEYLTDTPDSSKAITWAVVKQNGNIFALCNTHFWWKRKSPLDAHCELRVKNAEQLTGLMKHLRDKYSCPVFAFGDMNATVSEGIFDVYSQNGINNLIDMAEEKDETCTIHGDPVMDEDGVFHGVKASKEYIASFRRELYLPDAPNESDSYSSIDHIIALGDSFKVTAYRVIEDQDALDSTDHSPVYADIEFVF